MITALVEIDVEPQRIPETAEALAELPGVDQVWSVTGEHDLVALVRLREYDGLADLVTGRISATPGVLRTHTMLAFKVYARRDLEEAFSIGGE